MKEYKVLLLGTGFWGKRWINIIKNNERTCLAGVACGITNHEEIETLTGLNADRVFRDYAEAIENTDADIMVNVLPAELHFQADRLAMEKGMHIIAEKPLVKTEEEALKLIEIHEKTKRFFMVSQNYRWRPHNMAIKKALDDNLIGSLESIQLTFRRREDLQGYRKDLEYPLINDMLIHHVDLLRYFAGSDGKEIRAKAWRPSWSLYSGKPATDAMITMENGVQVSYVGTWAARGMETSWDGDIVLNGKKGCITLDADNVVNFYTAEEEKAEVLDTGKQKPKRIENIVMEHTETDYGLQHFVTCLDEGKTPITTLKDNYKSFAIVLACEKAAKTGETIII